MKQTIHLALGDVPDAERKPLPAGWLKVDATHVPIFPADMPLDLIGHDGTQTLRAPCRSVMWRKVQGYRTSIRKGFVRHDMTVNMPAGLHHTDQVEITALSATPDQTARALAGNVGWAFVDQWRLIE